MNLFFISGSTDRTKSPKNQSRRRPLEGLKKISADRLHQRAETLATDHQL
jgi:hypothetical protein